MIKIGSYILETLNIGSWRITHPLTGNVWMIDNIDQLFDKALAPVGPNEFINFYCRLLLLPPDTFLKDPEIAAVRQRCPMLPGPLPTDTEMQHLHRIVDNWLAGYNAHYQVNLSLTQILPEIQRIMK